MSQESTQKQKLHCLSLNNIKLKIQQNQFQEPYPPPVELAIEYTQVKINTEILIL